MDKSTGSWIECPFCKNTGKHMCPDVAEPIEIDCTHKQCPVMLQKKINELTVENENIRNEFAKDYEAVGKLLSVKHPHTLEQVEAYVELKKEATKLLSDNKRMFNALLNDGRFDEDMDKIVELEAKIKDLEAQLLQRHNDAIKDLGGTVLDASAKIAGVEAELLKHQFALDRMNHHVMWARTQDRLNLALNCLETACRVRDDILSGKTPVPNDWQGKKETT